MGLNENQFGMSNQKGTPFSRMIPNVATCRILSTSSDNFYGGTAVKLVDAAEKEIIVEKAAAGDQIFGFVAYSTKKNARVASDRVDILFDNCVQNMEAGAALLLGAELEIVATGDKVITNAGTNTKIGIALRKATASGDIIPVLIKTPYIAPNLADLPAIAFIDLSDTPATYSGSANDTVKVNGTNDGLVFVTV